MSEAPSALQGQGRVRPNEGAPLSFHLGAIIMTAGVLDHVNAISGLHSILALAIERHRRGHWGPVSEVDAAANDRALFREDLPPSPELSARRGRIYSVLPLDGVAEFHIITEAHRAVTMVLTREEC